MQKESKIRKITILQSSDSGKNYQLMWQLLGEIFQGRKYSHSVKLPLFRLLIHYKGEHIPLHYIKIVITMFTNDQS